ncbi:transposase [Siphonobacter sp. SORGH_AS_0500]|uniref:transposase n=1 Tax=Siphonobacter sp. SORGH_AS_0500 TaxID=1864824 RepID=UPI002862FDF8|nr:transposase [Siphonobacter sp. SORGH_AS_0500]MDR6197417.1 putative transposase [Siphonobacter sp. SORGH_AS_0500]
MDELYRNKYRIPSARRTHWDYGWNSIYFITICTRDRKHFFGEIINDEMVLNEAGMVTSHIWETISEQFSYVLLNEFVVMPNHMHGLLTLNHAVGQSEIAVANAKGGITSIHNPMFHENLSKVIRWYKGKSSYEIRKFQSSFGWQARFHDHIVRNDESLRRIQEYITGNAQL